MIEGFSAGFDTAALSHVVAAQRLVSLLAAPASVAHRRDMWQQLNRLLEKDDSDVIVSTVAFGLRLIHDIPDQLVLTLCRRDAAAVLFDEAEGISRHQWQVVQAVAPAFVQRRRQRDARKLATAPAAKPPVTKNGLGENYAQLKAALGELHKDGRLTNRLLADIVRIWDVPAVIGTLAWRSGLHEQEVLARLRDEKARKGLFHLCDFDAALVGKIRLSLEQNGSRQKISTFNR